MPIAVKSRCVRTRLRLCNKLTEVTLNLKLYREAIEFAKTAMDISMTLGMKNQLQHTLTYTYVYVIET